MHFSIAYYTRPRVIEVKVDNVIAFPDSYYPSLGRGGQLDNGYDFSKKCLTASKIL